MSKSIYQCHCGHLYENHDDGGRCFDFNRCRCDKFGREYPILFSAPMILALLANRKHVTRRLDKQWRKVKAGDRLWCRETWQARSQFDRLSPSELGKRNGSDVRYLADGAVNGSGCRDEFEWGKTRVSIFMPRWASRISLECEEDARVERLRDITEEDAEAEGVSAEPDWTACMKYATLWDSLHDKTGERWRDNPEVVRVGRFSRIEVAA